MPTFSPTTTFARDLKRLTSAQRARFDDVVMNQFVPDLQTGTFRPRLRVKHVQGTRGVWEMTWDRDGRATFEYGDEIRPGEAHVIWRRVGTHDIFGDP